MRRMSGVWVLMLAGGCVPGKEAQSAGHVGCTPEEISISQHQSQFGLIQSSETWVAECRGHTFVCSQTNQSGDDQGFFDRLLASEQVSCREAAEPPEAAQSRRIQEASLAERANRLPSTPPKGAAGFAFGETLEAVARRCEAVGETWRGGSSGNPADTSGCSGPAASIGIEASVDVGFCGGRACTITVEHVPRGYWSRSAVALKANLETKYGPAQESSGTVPEQCRSEQDFMRCLEAQQVALQYKWTWAGGESIEMTVGKPNPADHATIRLVYRRLVNANLLAL
jgi:hypothetical protein